MTAMLTSLHGRRLGFGPNGELVGNEIRVTHPCADATITVSAEGATVANQRDIVIQLKDINGANMTEVTEVELVVLLDAGGVDFVATGGSTGIAIGASGKLLTVIAKKLFRARSTAAGLITVIWTDTGTEVAFLGVKLPTSRTIISTTLQNA